MADHPEDSSLECDHNTADAVMLPLRRFACGGLCPQAGTRLLADRIGNP